jgi:hypothetical protein
MNESNADIMIPQNEMQSERRFGAKIASALAEAHKHIGAAVKGAANPFFKSSYASLGDVLAVCKEPLASNGLSILQLVGSDTKGTYLETILLHSSGESICSTLTVTPTKANDLQALGSAITYCRRYALQAMMCIPSVDDDAEWAERAARNRPEDYAVSARDLGAMQTILSQHEKNAMDATTEAERKKYQGLAADMRQKIQEAWDKEKPVRVLDENDGVQRSRADSAKSVTPKTSAPPDEIPGLENCKLVKGSEIPQPPPKPAAELPWPEHLIACIKSPAYRGKRLDSFSREEIETLHNSYQKKDLKASSPDLQHEAAQIAKAHEHWSKIQ